MKNRIWRTETRAAEMRVTCPCVHAMPRSSAFESSCVTHTPTRSPCVALLTGFLNICIDLILRVCLSSGKSISIPTPIEPESTVPVTTVPCPLIGKQWSMAKSRGPSGSRWGSTICARSAASSSAIPSGAVVGAAHAASASPAPDSAAGSAPMTPPVVSGGGFASA